MFVFCYVLLMVFLNQDSKNKNDQLNLINVNTVIIQITQASTINIENSDISNSEINYSIKREGRYIGILNEKDLKKFGYTIHTKNDTLFIKDIFFESMKVGLMGFRKENILFNLKLPDNIYISLELRNKGNINVYGNFKYLDITNMKGDVVINSSSEKNSYMSFINHNGKINVNGKSFDQFYSKILNGDNTVLVLSDEGDIKFKELDND